MLIQRCCTQQQNSRYPIIRQMIVRMTPQTRFGSSIMMNIPIAIQNRANPHTFFTLPLPGTFFLYYMPQTTTIYRISRDFHRPNPGYP